MFLFENTAPAHLKNMIQALYYDTSVCCSGDVRVTIKQDKRLAEHLGIWLNCTKCAKQLDPKGLEKPNTPSLNAVKILKVKQLTAADILHNPVPLES